ncbi:hypothetical protein SAMN04487948_12440 [Halogranum amylolyticum]|uniref:Polyprenyl synthetase n=1 Tax=Halogranum amylolyticum TaxID=660520 RepID=A0A1H8W742_9EURY|nr:hypothetical protein [Halogranum amylolyticum]SEP23237.1 hypothetical protein SAMN04487948_12440 [Halogranum amylolyticum]
MEDAVRVRDAAREALVDIEPTQLHEALDDRLVDASMSPGVLVLTSARALDPGVDLDGIAERAAGVQLIYEGLRLTRTLAQDEPWVGEADNDIDADLDILAADVLVSRGFYLLARTEAADRAVETVRAFGRDQTRQMTAQRPAEGDDRNLEADVFELAVVAGTTAVGTEAPSALLEFVASLAHEHDGDLPPATVALPETTAEQIASLSGDDRVTSSATDR